MGAKATRVRVPLAELAAGEQRLAPEVARYLGTVLRLRSGDPFVAFDPARGLEADAEVLDAGPAGLTARVGALRVAARVATRAITWLQAIPKGEKMDGIVRDATELGATSLVPVTTTFTIVRLEGPKRIARQERWERIAREAARQCGRSDAPVVHPVTPWEDALPASGVAGFCLYERATTPLAPALRAALREPQPIVFAAGPEGGLAASEVELAARRGFAVVSLGPFVLRAETVAAAALGALQVLAGLTDP